MIGYMDSYGKEYSEILSKTELLYDPMMATRFSCNRHIDYIIPDNDNQAANEYISFIVRECRIRGIRINFDDNVDEWRDKLRQSLAMESKIALLMKIKQSKEEGIKRAPLVEFVELLIPCILHLENRVGEKIITMILRIYGVDQKRNIWNTWRKLFRPKYLVLRFHLPTGPFHSRAKMTQS
jgi:hypothetical protein